MTLSDLARNATLAFCCTSFCLFFASERHALAKSDRDKDASLRDNSSLPQAQTSSKAKPFGQSTTKKLANPLNDLLDEAQRDIDQNQFEAAITPLQKVLADQPDFAYGHFQLAYVYTALKKSKEAQAEYQRAATLDPKMSAA